MKRMIRGLMVFVLVLSFGCGCSSFAQEVKKEEEAKPEEPPIRKVAPTLQDLLAEKMKAEASIKRTEGQLENMRDGLEKIDTMIWLINAQETDRRNLELEKKKKEKEE